MREVCSATCFLMHDRADVVTPPVLMHDRADVVTPPGLMHDRADVTPPDLFSPPAPCCASCT